MGNRNQTASNFCKQYKQIKKQSNALMGQVYQTLNVNNNRSYLMKIHSYADEATYLSHAKQLKHILNLKPHKNIINLYRVEEEVTKEYCGNTFRLFCLYDFIQKDLTQHYNQYLITNTKFTQHELLNIMISCVNGLIYIQDNGLKKCHISKKTIIYSQNEIKILDTGLVIQQHPYYTLSMNLSVADDVFLAPELLDDMRKDVNDPYISPKTDIFSLGMTILHLALQQPLKDMYNYEKYYFKMEEVKKKINQLQFDYRFKNIIINTLDPDPAARPGLITLQQKLQILIASKQQKQSQISQFQKLSARSSTQPNSLVSNQPKRPSILANSTRFKLRQNNEQPQITKMAESPVKKLNELINSYSLTYGKIDLGIQEYYEGQLKNGQPHGNGILYLNQTTICYSGCWKNGKYHGFGILYNRNISNQSGYQTFNLFTKMWIKYEGEFFQGKRHGYGNLFMNEHQKFSGKFKNDKPEGFGTYYQANGQQINGQWQNICMKLA